MNIENAVQMLIGDLTSSCHIDSLSGPASALVPIATVSSSSLEMM